MLTTIMMIVQLMMLVLMVMLMIVPLVVVVVRQHFLTSRPATSSVFCSPVVAIAATGGPQERAPLALFDLRALILGGIVSRYSVILPTMFVMAAGYVPHCTTGVVTRGGVWHYMLLLATAAPSVVPFATFASLASSFSLVLASRFAISRVILFTRGVAARRCDARVSRVCVTAWRRTAFATRRATFGAPQSF